MTSQFSPKVSEILAFSREEATRLASRSVGPEHLLLGILRERNDSINDLFTRLNLNVKSIKEELEQRVREEDANEPINTSELVLNEKASNILKLAVLEARTQHTQMVDVQHLLLAILHDQVNNGAKEVLEFNNMTYEDALTFLQKKTSQTQDGLGLPDEDEDEFEDQDRLGNNGNDSRRSTTTQTHRASGKTPVLERFAAAAEVEAVAEVEAEVLVDFVPQPASRPTMSAEARAAARIFFIKNSPFRFVFVLHLVC
jgi:ATP-dependent Clp protease ATP-binding subunit ClpC